MFTTRAQNIRADSAKNFQDLDIVVRHSCNQRLSFDRLLLCFRVNFMTVRDIFRFVCRWLDNIRFHFTAVATAAAATAAAIQSALLLVQKESEYVESPGHRTMPKIEFDICELDYQM